MIRNAASATTSVLREHKRRLYSLATDGESHRRRSFKALTLTHSLSPLSPIYSNLSDLKLLNLLCGDDDVTSDADWKHVLKRYQNTLLRINGVTINDIQICPAGIKKHLVDSGMKPHTASRFLCPNNRQDVTLMFSLLNSIARLPPASDDDEPSYRSTRSALRLLGALYRHLLNAYTNTALALGDQLMHISAMMHISCAIFRKNKSGFIPSQLMFDTQIMGKTAFFNVAKTKVDNPGGSY